MATAGGLQDQIIRAGCRIREEKGMTIVYGRLAGDTSPSSPDCWQYFKAAVFALGTKPG
jgi:hypothetical protein